MKFKFKQKLLQTKKAFTLLELSVALAVSGVLIAGGITAYKSTNPKLRSDLKKMEKIEEALQQFFTTNGRLPFPARPSDYNGTTYYLKEYKIGNAAKYSKATYRTTSSGSNTQTTNTQYCNSDSCTSYAGGISAPTSQMIWGVVPTRTLGLPDDYAYDSKGKNFEYITDLQLATHNNMTFANSYKKANYATNQQGTYEVLYTTTNTSYTSFTMPLFPLAIYSNNASRVVDGTSKNIAYVLLSKQNQSCFWNNRGKTATITNSTIPSNNTKYNCQANYSNGAPTSINIYQGYSKTFDNVVRYADLPLLIYKNANAEEAKNTITQGRIISYQPRDDTKLNTTNKNVIEAINELKAQNDKLRAELDELKAKIPLTSNTGTTYWTGYSGGKLYYRDNIYADSKGLRINTAQYSGLQVGTIGGEYVEVGIRDVRAFNKGNPNVLHINNGGGDVYVSANGTGSLIVGKSSGGTSKIYLNGTELSAGHTKKQICEMMYPVGSVYMNNSNNTDPSTLLGCGSWSRIEPNYYLKSADPNRNYNDFDAYEKSYGNFAGSYKLSCLPNIKGTIAKFNSYVTKLLGDGRAFYTEKADKPVAVKGGADTNDQYYYMYFDASRYNSIYRDNCRAVQPSSYFVYMWYRYS